MADSDFETEYFFQTRRLLYSTKKLRSQVDWRQLVSLDDLYYIITGSVSVVIEDEDCNEMVGAAD